MILSVRLSPPGITPACAGNTSHVFPHIRYQQDHPRLRGEYISKEKGEYHYEGSPPLARGIRQEDKETVDDIGITPACAGNTNEQQQKRSWRWDHPRLRGEYFAKFPVLICV